MIALGAGATAAVLTVALALAFVGGNKPKPAHRATTAATAPGAHGKPQNSGGGGLNRTTPGQSCPQSQNGCSSTATIPTVTGPSADWLGMQIITSPSGVVIDTIRPGSPADQGGFEPGDQIQSVDGHVLGTVSELRADTEGVKIGHPVTIKIMRSSTPLTSVVPMTQRPNIHP